MILIQYPKKYDNDLSYFEEIEVWNSNLAAIGNINIKFDELVFVFYFKGIKEISIEFKGIGKKLKKLKESCNNKKLPEAYFYFVNHYDSQCNLINTESNSFKE